VVRYEGALNRSYDRAFKQLHILQSTRRRLQPNEPKPDPDPAPAPTPVTPTIVSPIVAGLPYKGVPPPSDSPEGQNLAVDECEWTQIPEA
jgi:hypothetical protein